MELDFDFFNIEHNSIKPQKGRILISEPFLDDLYFKRSIIYITEHTRDGSVGFVLNNPADLSVNDIIKDFPKIDSGVSIGGPVGTNTIHYIHTIGDLVKDSVHVFGDIYWGGDFDNLKDLIEAGMVANHQVRFFLGYSGWTENQLDDEINRNSWIVSELEVGAIMKKNNFNIWKETVNKLGNKYKVWANVPENPTMN